MREAWFTDEKKFAAAPMNMGTRHECALLLKNMHKGDADASVMVRGAKQYSTKRIGTKKKPATECAKPGSPTKSNSRQPL